MFKFKGHTKIELTNVKTGEVEVIEDNNMVTNALGYFIKDIGMLGANPMVTNTTLCNNPIGQLAGGLLLLDTALTESADNIILPGNVKMIGNGAFEVSADGTDNVTELGSWSSTESGWLSDGKYQMVWDFTTAQANTPAGKSIACVCLTSANHGYIGEGNGNASKASRATKRSDYTLGGTPKSYQVDGNANTVGRILKIDYATSKVTYVADKNFFYDATYADQHMSTADLKVITQKMPISKVDLRESYPRNNNDGDAWITTTETTISLPSAFKTQLGNNAPWHAGRHGNYYYMLATIPGYLQAGQSVQGVKIDVSTLTATGFTITNSLDKSMVFNEADVMFGNNTAAIGANYGNTVGETRPIIFFQDLSTPADVSMIDNFAMRTDRYYPMQNYEDYCVYCKHKINFVDRTALPINGQEEGMLGSPVVAGNPLIHTVVEYDGGYWNDKTLKLYHSTNYLATINNLQTPVQKTAEKTMKITYTLDFSDGV